MIERHREDLRWITSVRDAIAVVMVVTAACAGDPPAATPTRVTATPSPVPNMPASPTPAPPPAEAPNLASVRIHLVRIANVEQPVALAVRSGDPALYVAEKTGRVVAIRGGAADRTPVVNLQGRVSLGTEQGLLGLAFSPDGRFLYVNYTDVNGHTHVTEFAMRGRVAAPASERDVLVVEQPFANHNGGNLVFGPDGHLYIGLGDGGSGGDPPGNGQSLSTLLGKMLRIIPRPTGGLPYGIPPDNPFVDRRGARPEIWAIGFRNPVAVLVRPSHRRPLDRRRRSELVGGDLRGARGVRRGGELRLEHPGGEPRIRR